MRQKNGVKVLGERKTLMGITVNAEIIEALNRYAAANYETASGCARRFIVERLRSEGVLAAFSVEKKGQVDAPTLKS